jgi:hypothetical protein
MGNGGGPVEPGRPSSRRASEPGPVAGQLRLLARSLLTTRGRAGREAVGGAALAVALAALVAEIAAWQTVRGRDHQAAAARHAVTDATELVLEHPPAAPRGRSRAAGGGNGRARGTPRRRGRSGRSGRRQNSEPTMTPPTGTLPRPSSASSPPLSSSAPAAQPMLWADRSSVQIPGTDPSSPTSTPCR